MHSLRVLSWVAVAGLVLLGGCSEPPRAAPAPQPFSPPASPQPASEVAITPARDLAADTTVQILESECSLTGVNLRMTDLISFAYRTPEDQRTEMPLLSSLRVVSAQPLPAGRYDVRIVAPGSKAPQLRALLRKTVESSFGISVRKEMRDSAVLALVALSGRLKSNPARADVPRNRSVDIQKQGRGGWVRTVVGGDDLSMLTEQLEEWLQQPVVNETKLQSPYTLSVQQSLVDGNAQPLNVEAARQALADQLGLDLIPGRRSIEFLVVEASPPGAKR